MDEKNIINATADFVKEKLAKDSSGHDYWHVYRVWQNAKYIAQYEQANQLVVELAALLHDIADWKFHDGKTDVGAKISREWLAQLNVAEEIIAQVCDIVANSSYKGAHVADVALRLEGQIVQDADRLDAIGAIGVARTFAYGGHKGRLMYDPDLPAVLHTSFEQYKNNNSHTINHFYEKLLLLKDRMHTKTAKVLAAQRHQFMEQFLAQFMQEWQLSN